MSPPDGSTQTPRPVRVLITAGPTHEPIDAVRFLGNRSSGKLGIELARAARERGHHVSLLLGPTPEPAPAEGVTRFRTHADLRALLERQFGESDVLIMAAAVADFRPRSPAPDAKIRRSDDGKGLSLELEPTSDLLAEVGARRRAGQIIIAFALEPAEDLERSARAKLERKGSDAIIANPLETMDSDHIDATMFFARDVPAESPGPLTKRGFADWLIERVERMGAADAGG